MFGDNYVKVMVEARSIVATNSLSVPILFNADSYGSVIFPADLHLSTLLNCKILGYTFVFKTKKWLNAVYAR